MLHPETLEQIKKEAEAMFPANSEGLLHDYPVKWLQEEKRKVYVDCATRAAERENKALQAFEQITEMKLERGESDYKYAFNRCWHIASEMIKKLRG